MTMTRDELALLQLNPRLQVIGTVDGMQAMENWRRRQHEARVGNGHRGQATRRKMREEQQKPCD